VVTQDTVGPGDSGKGWQCGTDSHIAFSERESDAIRSAMDLAGCVKDRQVPSS
jgi:hypothetical protein